MSSIEKILALVADVNWQQEMGFLRRSEALIKRAEAFVPRDQIVLACQYWNLINRKAKQAGLSDELPSLPENTKEEINDHRTLRSFSVRVGKSIIKQNGLMSFCGEREKLLRCGEKIEISCPQFHIKFKTEVVSNGLRFGKHSRSEDAFGGVIEKAGRKRLLAGRYSMVFTETAPGKFRMELVEENKSEAEKVDEMRRYRNKITTNGMSAALLKT